MEGGELRFTLLTESYDGVMNPHSFNHTLHYCSFNESDLEVSTDPYLTMSVFKGNPEKDIPIFNGITNCVWSASPPPPHVASSNVPWTLFPTDMNVERSHPVLLPLRDGRIFICGGTAELESWAEIYDPVKGQFEARKLSDGIGYPSPNSCFQWTDELVMIYYHRWVYDKNELYHPSPAYAYLGEDKEHQKPSLLSYNMRTEEWDIFAENLPGPSYHTLKRNLVCVGGDTLFIIDKAYLWFVYDLSSKEEVGKVKVEGERKEDEDVGLMRVVYAGNNVIESTSWVIYLFYPDIDNIDTSLRYSKVEVVQGKGGDYVATVRLSGVLRVGFCSDFYVIADRVSAAEEEKMIEK